MKPEQRAAVQAIADLLDDANRIARTRLADLDDDAVRLFQYKLRALRETLERKA